jgi:hypothetical protein
VEHPEAGGIMQRKTALCFLAILLLSMPVLTWLYLHRQLQQGLEQQYAFANQVYDQLSAQRLSLLHAVVDQIALRGSVQEALQDRDRQQLLFLMQPVMAHLAEEQGISLLYFHDTSGKTLLRVHQPEAFGERLNRYLLSAAMQKREVVQGLEIGPQGLFFLRVIHPLLLDGKLLGFIEMGEDIDGVVQQVQEVTGSRLLLTVNKAFVSRDGWEAGARITGRENSWDLLPDSVIPHALIGHFAPELHDLIFAEERSPGDTFDIMLGGEHHAGKVFLLHDTVHSVVGNRLILRDITEDIQWGQLILLLSIILSITLAGLLMVVLRKE